jgi:hypothetical protein
MARGFGRDASQSERVSQFYGLRPSKGDSRRRALQHCQPQRYDISDGATQECQPDTNSRLVDIILESLHFPGMERYHHRPLESHPGTFDWLFDQRSRFHVCDFESPSRPGQCGSEQECDQVEAELRRHASKLQTWLETSDDIFWVQGKAGSGKSTLMKFLFEHEQTQVHLQRWAGGDVIAAAFFFWRAGSAELEKSYLGLLRALLYQVLQERPELIELVLPQRWRAVLRSVTYKKPWTKSELVTAFDFLLQAPETNLRFCLFIDGLDEFDGDHRDLIDAIRLLSKSPFIKVCVSSRPWGPFQREYGSDDRLHVTLHTLTKRDIETYVATKLQTAARSAPSVYCTRGLERLGNAVCARSEGVFLWVSLAVKDLRRGIEEQDSLSALHDRLEGYPSELRDFIQRIFDAIDPAYKRLTGRLLLVMLEYTGPPALISLNFLEDAFTVEGEYAVDTRWSPRSNTEMYSLIDRAAICANKWYKDLLQPVDPTEVKKEIDWVHHRDLRLQQQVDTTLAFYTRDVEFQHFISHLSFSHRSIHQFAEEKAGDGTLLEMAGQNFDYRLAWLCTFVELSRCAPDLFNFIEVFNFASWLLLNSGEHHLLAMAEEDKLLAYGIHQCLEAFDLIGQNIETSSKYSHWTAARLVDENFSNQKLRRRIPTGSSSECSSFVSCLVYLPFPDFIISPILTQKSESFTELQKQFVLENSLIPLLYRDSYAEYFLYRENDDVCMLGHPAHYHNIIVQVMKSGIDVNRPTERIDCRQDYSVWQFFLLWLHDYFHEQPDFRRAHSSSQDHVWCRPGDEVGLIKDTTRIFRVFLQHGADPFAVISSVDLIECYEQDATFNKATFLSVADVLGDLRAEATWQLAHYDDPHAWLASRLAVVGELEELLDKAYTQRYLASSHATALSTTA